MNEAQYEIRSTVPLLMHNGQLANPIYSWTLALKALTAKRKKTLDEFKQIALVEWFGGLYTDLAVSPESDTMSRARVVVPSPNIIKAVIQGAQRNRLGKAFAASVYCKDAFYKLEYPGPQDVVKLSENPAFQSNMMVVVNRMRISRCRPIFTDWGLKFTLIFDDVELSQVNQAVADAGSYVGIGDYRPQYGRFEVVE